MTGMFPHRKLNPAKLLAYGFAAQEDRYTLTAALAEGQMRLTITVFPDGGVGTQVTDCISGEEYVLHRVPGAAGAFVGRIKAEYTALLEEISARCFDPDAFQSRTALELIACVRERYGDELEFLWPKFPDNAVWRRKDNQKWYAALLTVRRDKLGLAGTDTVEILDLRIRPEELEDTLDHRSFFPGYHMNKKHWYTILLDGSVPVEELCRRLDESYRLAK